MQLGALTHRKYHQQEHHVRTPVRGVGNAQGLCWCISRLASAIASSRGANMRLIFCFPYHRGGAMPGATAGRNARSTRAITGAGT